MDRTCRHIFYFIYYFILHLPHRINVTERKGNIYIYIIQFVWCQLETLKDHKPNFANNPTCRLINPAKSEIGKISKQLLDRINTALVSKLKLNQWKNTKAVLAWFTGIQHKELHSFIAFDVVEFYPSISADLRSAALEFASNHVTICDDERHIIL